MISPADVAAVIPTRGDHPDGLAEIIDSLPYGEVIVWDNSTRLYNLGVFGRFAAIAEATKPYIYTQDDDVIVLRHADLWANYKPGHVTGIMPTDLLPEHCLLGYGAVFDADLPNRMFARWLTAGGSMRDLAAGHCDMIFGTLAQKVRLEYGPEGPWHRTKHQDTATARAEGRFPVRLLPYHFGDIDPGRMHMQAGHDERRHRIYDQCIRILDGMQVARRAAQDYGDHDQRR